MYMQSLDNNFRVCCLVCAHPDIYVTDTEPAMFSCTLMPVCPRIAKAEAYDRSLGMQREQVYPTQKWIRKYLK